MAHLLYLCRHAQSLCLVIHIGLQVQRLTFFFFGIDGFLYLVYILMNERVSGIDDGLGRAVVLLKFEEFGVGINLPEIEDVADVGTAEGIDALRIVAHHADVVLRFSQTLNEQELDVVRILVLIDQNILELLLVFLADFGTEVHEPQHVDEQVVEVHGIGCAEPDLVLLVDACQFVHAHLTVFA